MKKSFFLYRMICAFLCCSLLALTLCVFAGAGNAISYSVYLDHPKSASGNNAAALVKDIVHGSDPTLTLSGWVKTDLVMDHYEYSLNGGKNWITAKDSVVRRDDVKTVLPNTYKTAGFYIPIDVSGLLRGQYDLFVRGYTTTGQCIDVLAMLNTSIGPVDTETVQYRELNLSALGSQNGTLSLTAGQSASLGSHNIADFLSIEFVLDTEAALTIQGTDTDSPYRFSVKTDQVIENSDGSYTVTASLKQVTYPGEISVSASADVNVSRVRLYYNTPEFYTGPLDVYMTATPSEYLGGANYADFMLLADDTVGTYTQLSTMANTNDPFIYFSMGSYLKKTQGLMVSADHYRYAVFTLRTPKTNSAGRFGLYLCAGAIRGPSGNSHISFQPINDGQWHHYIVPLYEEENWIGQIHGMRFDFIENVSVPTDYSCLAKISFYSDLESAQEAANAPFAVYHEQGIIPEDLYKEENRAPSGKADAITWFDSNYAACFGGENKVIYSFDKYGHLFLSATETHNDPYISFDLQTYASIAGTELPKADDYRIIVLRILADKNISGKDFSLYYYANGLGYAEGTRKVSAEYQGEQWEYLVYDMTNKPHWTGDILGMRLDFASQINAGQRVCLSDILFFADKQTWYDYAKENGIPTDQETQAGDDPAQTETETERPTIEIPTQGPGLEYIPPEQAETEIETHPESRQGCTGFFAIPAFLVIPAAFAICLKSKTKKGEES